MIIDYYFDESEKRFFFYLSFLKIEMLTAAHFLAYTWLIFFSYTYFYQQIYTFVWGRFPTVQFSSVSTGQFSAGRKIFFQNNGKNRGMVEVVKKFFCTNADQICQYVEISIVGFWLQKSTLF